MNWTSKSIRTMPVVVHSQQRQLAARSASLASAGRGPILISPKSLGSAEIIQVAADSHRLTPISKSLQSDRPSVFDFDPRSSAQICGYMLGVPSCVLLVKV